MPFGENGPEYAPPGGEIGGETSGDDLKIRGREVAENLTKLDSGESARVDSLPKGSLLAALSKNSGENYGNYIDRLWTAKIGRVKDLGAKGDCVAIREYLAKKPREVIVFSELMAMAKDELKALKLSFSDSYFDKIDEKTFLAFLVNEMVDRSLTAAARVETYKTFLMHADVAKIPSRDQSASFGLAQTIKDTYYGVAGKYNDRLPVGKKLPGKFKECVKARDQLRLAMLLAYENMERIGLAVEKNPGLRKLFNAASVTDQQQFLTALLARAHNAGPRSVERAVEALKGADGKLRKLGDCLPYLYKNSEIVSKKTGEKRTLIDGDYTKGAVSVWEVL